MTRTPYAQVPGRVVVLQQKDISKYCRDYGLSWDEFWRRAEALQGQQSSAQAEEVQEERENEADHL